MERSSIRGVLLICMAAGAAAGTSSAMSKTYRTDNGVVAVASIAGVTSRNGRVSSVSGVKFFPAAGGESSFYFPKLKAGEKIPEPITFSREENGRITSGSIKYGPGSVSVSSSARSAYPDASSSKGSKVPLSDMLFQFPSLPTFHSRSFDPWFPKDAFKPPSFPKISSLRSGWPFSSPFSNSFNIWQ